MKASDYQASSYGSIQRDYLGHWSYGYFMPSLIDSNIELSKETQGIVSEAQLALGKLAGLAMVIQDPEILLAPSLMKEALSSSRIEGTEASLSEVLSAEIQESKQDQNLREVFNYLEAIKAGSRLLSELPLTSRLFCSLHKILMSGVRGEEKYPGEIRRTPVWVGTPGGLPADARYIPPLHDKLSELITDWENFVNNSPVMPSVVKCSLMHYQFETIHPFLDGNGRIGRLLIGLLLMQDQVLSQPVLYLSGYFERNRTEYYERLQSVRERGEMDAWVRFFSRGVLEQANESATRISNLIAVQRKYREKVLNDRSGSAALVDIIFKNPLLTVRSVQEELQVSQPTASKILKKAEEFGWLKSLGRHGRGGKETWFAIEVWKLTADESSPD